jgi:hypothetical protein
MRSILCIVRTDWINSSNINPKCFSSHSNLSVNHSLVAEMALRISWFLSCLKWRTFPSLLLSCILHDLGILIATCHWYFVIQDWLFGNQLIVKGIHLDVVMTAWYSICNGCLDRDTFFLTTLIKFFKSICVQ